MSLIQRRRALMGALSEAQKILPGTVIWENLVTGTDNLTVLEQRAVNSGGSLIGGAWNEPNANNDIVLTAQRSSSATTAGACVVGFGSPLDFSLCTVLKCQYTLAVRSDYSGALIRMGLGALPPEAKEFLLNPAEYLPDESAWERTVPTSTFNSTQEITIPSGIGVKVPMLSIRTVGNYSGGYLLPLKIWVE